MKGAGKLSFCKGDWLAIVIVMVLIVTVACCYGSLLRTAGTNTVQIYMDNQMIKEYALEANEVIPVEGRYRNVIEISEGKVRIKESNCPGEDCIHSGSISQVGRSIVCLPNKVEVRIVGTADSVPNAVDGVADTWNAGTDAADDVDIVVR